MDCEAYRDQMLDQLYGEGGDAARRAVEEHQARCASCRDELAAFKRLRRDLQTWSVPAVALPRRARASEVAARLWPGLAAAAAALLALGTVAGLYGGELRRDESGWSLRVGRPGADLAARLDEQEQRHRAEIAQLRASLATPAAADRQALLAAAQELVHHSEQRQDARLQEALARLGEHYDAQRRYDLAQVSAGMSYLEGKAGLHAARTTELVGQVLMASQDQEK
jgi:hypothetical protein